MKQKLALLLAGLAAGAVVVRLFRKRRRAHRLEPSARAPTRAPRR